MEPLHNNVFDCALAFEGGGYRGAYTAGIANVLLENSVWFDYVCGISAGASSTLNYLSRDHERLRTCFLALPGNEPAGGLATLLRGKGYFNSDYIYEGCIADGVTPFDWETFVANPARLCIQAFDSESGRTVRFSKTDMPDIWEAMKRVRASSTIPGAMPPEPVEGRVLFDGGLGEGAGLPLVMAEADGLERFVLLATREAGYRKKPFPPTVRLAVKRLFRSYPHVVEAILTRAKRYNQELDRLAELEREGRLLSIRPDVMPVKNTTLDSDKLARAYDLGHEQGQRELERIYEFVGL